ncbi:hypothetical protein A9Q87_03075 [Flavobacteriales bacterium 34_180_T64]|nr:hypothetical protein A9Q87_03075 [Flavobacteriales bacterium 34_180_T64]
MEFQKLISELSRRNVFKSVLAYLAVAWVLLQIASIILPAFELPDYSLKVLIYLMSIGLPFWIGFSWVYDYTSKGFQKTKNIIYDKETIQLSNKRLNKVIAVSLLIAVLLLVGISFWAGSRWNEGLKIPDTKRVAVIPFIQKDEGEEDYFKNGMTDALIAELSKVDQLTVIDQASTRVFTAGFSPNNLLVSNELRRIDYFISGSVNRQLNTLNIHIELKESSLAEAIWKKEYTKDITEVRRLWADVAHDLARQMSIVVKQENSNLWLNLRSVKPETFELYLKGKHFLNKSTPKNWSRGIVYLEEAIDKNPSDPYAYAGLAEGYVMLGHGPAPPPDVFPKANVAAQRAIQLDSTNAEGWAALAHYHTYFGWDWELAEYAFNRANELNPNMAYNHYHRAWYLALFGEMNEAIDEHKLAQELDPFTPLHTAWLGELYRMVGLYDEGLAETDKASQMHDDYALSMLVKGRIFMDQGRTKEGLEILKQASDINPGWKYFGYGSALIQSGYLNEGKAIIKELENMPITAYGAFCLGLMYTELGDFDNAIKWFSHDSKHGWYPWIRVYAKNTDLLKNPRFLELIQELNLPDPAPLVFDSK